jgi:hypothetical protein
MLTNPIPVANAIVCPCCGGPVTRVPKRMIDRLLEPLRGAKRRYRCTIVTCGWTTSENVETQAALLRAWKTSAHPGLAHEDSGPRKPGFGR